MEGFEGGGRATPDNGCSFEDEGLDGTAAPLAPLNFDEGLAVGRAPNGVGAGRGSGTLGGGRPDGGGGGGGSPAF